MPAEYRVFSPPLIGEVAPGDSVAAAVADALDAEGLCLQEDDVLVLAHKIVSKAEGRIRTLDTVVPSPEALELARITGKPAALVEVILSESREVLWAAGNGLLLCWHRLGFVCANAAVDCSNAGSGRAILLPEDPDASARGIRRELEERYGCHLGVIICDTHGKPFREGACGTVIGASGAALLKSYIGLPDRDGRVMQSSVEAVGDELAGAATALMGQGAESRPAAVIRGLHCPGEDSAQDLIRSPERDVFFTALRQLTKK